MRMYQYLLFLVIVALGAIGMRAQEEKYSPLSEYLMSQDDEIALAKSAAPQTISDNATIRVFTLSGYQTMHEGNNGFVCMVMRGFTGAPTFTPLQVRAFVNYDPKTRAPICLNPAAVRTVLPYYELRTKLGLEGKTAEKIAAGVEAAYAKGAITTQTQNVEVAKARAEQAAADEARYRGLVSTGAVFASTYDQIKAAADAAKAQLAAVEAQAQVAKDEGDYSLLVADADGVVVETLAEPGQVVAAGQTGVKLAHAGPREAAVYLPETVRPTLWPQLGMSSRRIRATPMGGTSLTSSLLPTRTSEAGGLSNY